ncbi:hypothetical protein HYW41_00750 [Candidatus Daviesbacteria bacterium]|nr:hypothetical protein [Candidatus Daviesbacteria bacterium]
MSVEAPQRTEDSFLPQLNRVQVPQAFEEAFAEKVQVPAAFIKAFESQQPEAFTPVNSGKLMRDVNRLRWFYYSRLGMEGEINEARNFDPPLLRAIWEQLKTPQEQRMFIAQQTDENIPTALGERYNVVESIAKYVIKSDGKLYSEAFPNEPFEDVVNRGIEHSRNLGSPDADREEAQFRGILSVQGMTAESEVPAHLKIAFISGPRFQEGTSFTKNFIDVYELMGIDPIINIRYLQMTRFTSSASYKQYEANVRQYRPNYFDRKTEGPVDNYYAENGIKIDPKTDTRSAAEISMQLAGAAKGVLSKDNLQEIINDGRKRISYFMEAICASVFNPQEVALRWNAILAGADRKLVKLKGVPGRIVEGFANFIRNTPIFKNLDEEINWLGKQMVAKVAAACGLSGGFSFGGITESIGNLASGVVRGISGLFSKDKDFCIRCGACGEVIKCVVRKGQKCPKCPAIRKC